MNPRELGEQIAQELIRSRIKPSDPKGKFIVNLAKDMASDNRDLNRVIKDACLDPQFESLLRSTSRSEMLLIREAIISQSSAIYSYRMTAAYDSFLGGLVDYYLTHSEFIVNSQYSTEALAERSSQSLTTALGMPSAGSAAAESKSKADISEIIPPTSEAPLTHSRSSPISNKRKVAILSSLVAIFAFGIGAGITFLSTNTAANNDAAQSNPSLSDANLDTYDKIISSGLMRVGAQAESPPMNYVEDGKRVGLDFEILSLISRQQEIGLSKPGSLEGDVNVDDYARIPSLLQATDNRGGYKVDLVAGGLTFKNGDLPNVRFTIPYLDGFGYSLLVPKGSPIKTIEQLSGKRVGIIDGDPDVEAFVRRSIKGANIVKVSDASESWQEDAFSGGVADAIVYDFPFASSELKGAPIDIAISRLPGSNLEYRFGVRSQDKKLLEKLNSAIRRIKDGPEYTALLRKYLSTENVITPSSAGKKTYVVKPGDTLAAIAAAQLGSADKWTLLQDLNNLPNPNFIDVGQKLIVSVSP